MALIPLEADFVPFDEEQAAPDTGNFISLEETGFNESPLIAKADPTLGEFTGKMFGAGVDQVQGLGYGFAGLAGDLAGSETVKQFGLEGFQRNMQEAAIAREDVGMVDFTDIDGVGSAGKWAYGTLMEQLPQLLPTIGLGGAGGIVGKQLVKKGLQEVIETGVSSGLSRQAAEAAVANAVATRGGAKAFLTGAVDKAAARQLMEGGVSRAARNEGVEKLVAEGADRTAASAIINAAAPGFTREATEQSLGKIAAGKLAPQAGVAAGNIASGQAMSMGSIYGDTEDAGLGLGYGAAAGAVEGLADTILFSPFTKRAFGVDVADRVAKNRSLPKEIGKGFAKGVAVEGPLEEYPQTYIEQMARAEADPTFDINSEEAKRERLNAMAAGSVVGGTIGPVGGALEALAPRTKEALNRFTQKPLSDPETGLPAEPQTPQAREYDPEPVTLENGTVLRRFKIAGTSQEGWAVENAPEGALDEVAKANAAFFDDGKLILAPGFTASATLIQRAEDARAKALGKIDEKEAEQGAPAKKLTPFTAFKEAEAIFNEFNEDLKKAEAEVFSTEPTLSLSEKSQDGQTAKSSGSYPEVEGSTPSPAPSPDIDAANEIAKATLDLEPVAIVDTIEEVSNSEDLDANAVSLLDDAQRALEDAITQIEARDLPPDAKKAATDPLYTKLDQVDRIQREYNPEKEPSEKLPPAPLEKELEVAQAEYERKLAEQQQATKEALDSRTDEQTQEFVKNLPTGTKVIVDLDGPNDIVGSVEKNKEGALVVRDQNNKPRVVPPALHDRVALAPTPLVKPTLETTVQAALGPKPDYDTLTRAGFDSAGQTTEKVGDTIYTGVPVFSFKDKGDRVAPKTKLNLKATFYTEEGASAPTPKFFYEHSPKRTARKTTATKETDLREMLRAMDRGYEVRIPNDVEVPQGVQTTPVEGTNYSVVTGIQNFSKRGVNLGSFTWGDKGLRHLDTGREGNGTFAEVWQGNKDIQAIRADLSAQNNRTRQERGTDATTGAAKRAAGFNEIGTAIFSALYNGGYGARINYIANSDELSGASPEARENFRDDASNKLLNALGGAGLNEAFPITSEQRPLIQKTIAAYLEKQSAEKGAAGGKLPQTEINVLKKGILGDATAKTTPEARVVNATLDALQAVAMFSNPKTQQTVLQQSKIAAFRKPGARSQSAVSLDAPVGDESGAVLGDFVTGKGTGMSGATSAAKEAKSNKELEAQQGEVSEEEAKVIEAQEKEATEIANAIDDETLESFENSLSPLEKIAYDWLTTANTWRSRKQKLYGQLEDQIEDPDEFIRDLEEKIANSARRAAELAGGKTYSPAASSERNSSFRLEGGTLTRTSTSDSVRRIKRRFLQARAGLTDEQIVAMADDEIDRTFLAFNARADESRAAKAQDAVVSVAPGIEDLQALSTDELLSEYAKQVREAAESGDMGKVRDANFAELVRLGAFASTREFLTRVADPKNGLPRDMQLRAKAFLGMEKRGFKLDAIEIQAANFLKTGTPDRASWAGLLGRSADYKSFGVYINLDQAHDRETPAQTILHELSHAATLAKINGQAKLTPDEKQAIADLNTMRRRAILRAGDASPTIKAEAEAQGITDPRDRTAFYETRLRELSSTDPEFRDYNGLANLDEFVVEMTGSPEFLDLLRRLGFGGADTDRKSLGGMIRDAFKAILKLIAPGISASSEIGKAFTDSWNLTYAGSKPVVKAGELLQATRGITEVKEAAPVPKKGTKKKSSAVDKKSTTVDATAPQGNKGSTTSDNDKTATPESNNQSNAQPESKNPEVPSDGQAGKGSGAKVKRDKPGRPPKREMRDDTQLPTSREEFDVEMAQSEMTAEEREAEFKEAPQSPAALQKPHVLHTVRNAEDIPKVLNGIRVGTNISIDSTKVNQSFGAGGITLVIDPNSVQYKSKGYRDNEGVITNQSKPRVVEVLVDRDGYGQEGVSEADIDKSLERALERMPKLESDWEQAKKYYQAVLSQVNEQAANTGRVSQNLSQELKVAERKRDIAEIAYLEGAVFDTEVLPSIAANDEIREQLSELIGRYPVYSFDTDENGNPVEFQKVQSPAAKPRVVRASALTDDERNQAELRASNMEDILFYSGIAEDQYYNLIGKGILSPKEIEAGYMQDVPQMLSNISGDETQPGPLRHVAQMLLDLGFDFSKVRFRVAETADTQAEGGWAGLYEPGTSARGGRISINMDSDHRGGIAQSIVHEALHHVFYWKTQKGYPLNRVERAAFNDLQKIFKQAERVALGRYTRAGESIGQARARLAPGDLFYGLTNVDEFITEILTNPEFQVFLQQTPPMQGLPKKGGYIRNLLDQIFSYFRDFVYGRDVSGDSLLTQGLDNVLALIQTPQTESGVQRAMDQMLGEPVARATMPQAAPIERYGDALLRIAREGGQNLFSLPYNSPGADSKDLKTVLDSFGGNEKFSLLESTKGKKFISLTSDLKVGDEVFVPNHVLVEWGTFPLPKTQIREAKIVSIQGDTATVEQKTQGGKVETRDYPLSGIAKELGIRIDPKGDNWSTDSSSGGKTPIPLSSEIYQGIYRWAKNNGTKIVPDDTTSFAGNMRRNAHQLSSALREQSAEHFVPTDDQLSKMFPADEKNKRLRRWETRNTSQKIEALARAEVNYVEQLLPDLVQLTYDPTSDSIMEAGKSLDNDRGRQRVREILDAAKKRGPSDTDRVGERTAYRYLAAKSWLSLLQGQAPNYDGLNRLGTLDGAFMSPAGDLKKTVAKLTGKEIIPTYTGGTYEKGGLLSTDGKLDKRGGDLWRKRGMRIGAQERMVNMAVQKLVAAVKAERKAGREVSTGLMNTALGNLDNPLTRPQRNEVEALRAEAKEAKPKQREAIEKEANELEAAYMAKNREAFKVRQAQALAQLPEDVAEAISEMTQHITALSSALKAAGILEPGLGATIDANLGIYLHRSYEIFDNPKWKEAVLKNEKIINDAQNLLRRNIEGRNADKLIAMAAEEGGILPRAEAMRQARGTAKQDEVDRMLEQLLAVGEESLGGVILRGRIPGQMDLSILDARGNISPEIQALWGRYEDPTINYAKTALKITTLLENNAFLGDLRSLGLKEGWLHEGADHPPGYLKISSDNNKSLAPIAGLYGNRDFVEALYAMYPPNGIAENYEWVRFFSKLTGVSMASKTVLSAAAHVRNFAGNFLNLAASGNLGINDLPFLSGGRYKKALNLTIRSTFSNMSAQQFKDTIKELTELGVLNESLTSGLLKDLIGTKRVAGNALAFSDSITDRLLKKPAAAIWDVAQKSYGSGDEFFKVVIYLSEMEKYRKAMPQWSEKQLKENAAKIARDVHWTYSLSPVAVGKIKQFPFVAPFITFTTEVIRTTRNTMALAYNEIKEGNRTGNKELTAIGWKRVRGMGVAALAPTTAAGAIGMMAGISGEDDDDLRRFLPDWQKNSQLMVFRNKDGKVSFIDVSYLDPYEYWKRPITAFLRAIAAPDDSSAMERITEGAVQAGAQLLNPFASEQILSGAILDIARNQKQDGGQLWNPEDTGARVAAKIGDHLWNAFEPGTLTSAGRIKDAALGNVSDSGRSYGLGNEVASVLLGQRVSELDVTQALGFKTSRTSRALRDASSLFTREFSSKGTRSDEQIMDAYNRANDATFEIAKDYREDVDAAMRLSGMTAKQISEIASAGGLGKEKIKMILSGRFTRYTPSKDQIKLAKALGNQDRITSAREAESAAPKVRELR